MQNTLPACDHFETFVVNRESLLKQDLSMEKYFTRITELSNLHRLWFKINKSNSTKYRFVEFNKNLYGNLKRVCGI